MTPDEIRAEAITRIATVVHARRAATREPVRISGADLTIGEIVDALGDLLPTGDAITVPALAPDDGNYYGGFLFVAPHDPDEHVSAEGLVFDASHTSEIVDTRAKTRMSPGTAELIGRAYLSAARAAWEVTE